MWLKSWLENIMARDASETEQWERIQTELKGSIFALVALFQLVSFLSYLPIDSLSIFQGRLDHVFNLGGIFGALLSEWFLGTVGIVGFVLVGFTLFLSISSFRGKPMKKFQFLGILLASILSSITFHLVFEDKAPEASLLQGGWVGTHVGDFLKHYLNTTGSLLLVGGSFLITLILMTGFSFNRFFSLFRDRDDNGTAADEVKLTPVIVKPRSMAAVAPAKKSRKRKPKKEDADSSSDGETTTEIDSDPSNEDPTISLAPVEGEFQEVIPFDEKYQAPSLRLLKSVSGQPKRMSRGEAKENAKQIIDHLLSFQITGEMVAVTQGPVLTTYEFKPSAGVKLSKIAALQEDLGVVLGTRELRIVAPIPGKTVVGIEVPRPQSEMISLKELLGEKEFHNKKYKLPFALGKTTEGITAIGDMAAMPHLLVAGSTGSGKSVFVNSLIMSFLFKMSPQELRMILIDPKMLEFAAFDGIPHLISNVITDNKIACRALAWTVQEMDRRYALMAQTGSKNLESYNSKAKGKDKLPFLVVVVDELADLMMTAGEEVEISITRLAQKSRAAGIHMVIATQRPSTDIVTGLIKANIPSRIAFKVTSGIDSRTILDTSGAEELIGRGDSLMVQPSVPLRRIHGAFVTEDELARTTKYLKYKNFSKYYIKF